MGFLDSVKEVGLKAKEEAKDLGEIGVLKVKIAEQESQIKKAKEAIINDALDKHFDHVKDNYPEQVGKIEEAQAKIQELKAQIEAVKAD